MNEIMGTTFLENGKWLLRHEGGAGNKVPLLSPKEVLVQLKHGQAQIFEGSYGRDHRGVEIAAHVVSIKTFEKASTDPVQSP
ncbi:hypothetical protein B5P46_08050 [Rhizobium leguminosarum]|uniref:Uncharacterized protein n=1 Tax=Rhizobium leguminosarum TaxID=384 RepID=A0A4Q1UA42_RHILE|nr:hypothetical protein [Rhizobium leguminosarum]RXT28716.1 hypothetical protein B5P46_08050 [Rhizobium leguminosarum]